MTEKEAKRILAIIHDIKRIEEKLKYIKEMINEIKSNDDKVIEKIYDYVLEGEKGDNNGVK